MKIGLNIEAQDVTSRAVHRGRWVLVALMIFVVIAAGMTWLTFLAIPRWGFQPHQMSLAQYTPSDVIGELGGMPVTIPVGIAEYVEYDGDPRLGEHRLGSSSVRTHSSRLRSFGIPIRYPDMAVLTDPGAREDKQRSQTKDDRWLNLGLTAGEFYPGGGFLDRATYLQVIEQGAYWFTRYEKLKVEYAGLEVFAVSGLDESTGSPNRMRRYAYDVFVARDDSGKVKSFIRCANYPVNPSCMHHWSLESFGVEAEVSATYRRTLLREWQKIQSAGTAKILSFQHLDSRKEVASEQFPVAR